MIISDKIEQTPYCKSTLDIINAVHTFSESGIFKKFSKNINIKLYAENEYEYPELPMKDLYTLNINEDCSKSGYNLDYTKDKQALTIIQYPKSIVFYQGQCPVKEDENTVAISIESKQDNALKFMIDVIKTLEAIESKEKSFDSLFSEIKCKKQFADYKNSNAKASNALIIDTMLEKSKDVTLNYYTQNQQNSSINISNVDAAGNPSFMERFFSLFQSKSNDKNPLLPNNETEFTDISRKGF